MSLRPDAAPIAGLLANGGARPLYLSVCGSAVPPEPPEGLRGTVVPVHDDDGTLVDWRLPDSAAESQAAFRTWRHGFTEERFIGEKAFVQAFLGWAHHQVNVTALRALLEETRYINFSTALRARSQVANVRRLVSDAGDEGFGIFAPPDHHSPARALLPAQSPTTILATGRSRVTARSDGVILHQHASDGSGTRLNLKEWRLHGDGADVTVADGTSVRLTDPDSLLLLQSLGRKSAVAALRRAPLHTLAAPVLLALSDVTALAVNGRSGISARIG